MNEQWISDCDGNLIGWIYQDYGRNGLWCFGPEDQCVVRTLDFVEGECKRLCEQAGKSAFV